MQYTLDDLRSGGKAAGDTQIAAKVIDDSIKNVNRTRAELGSFQRYAIQSWGNVLDVTGENLQAARSRIQDTDYALEIANMVRLQALTGANLATLAMSNVQSQRVLGLLG